MEWIAWFWWDDIIIWKNHDYLETKELFKYWKMRRRKNSETRIVWVKYKK